MNNSWQYRKEISLGTVSSDQTDYQIQLTGINTQTLFNEGKLQSNCEDVRFTDIQGNLLNYRIENNGLTCQNNTSTDFWIKLKRLEAEGTKIYMYYGNPVASSYSSGSNTFEHFDEFTGDVNNLWLLDQTPVTAGGLLLQLNNGDKVLSKKTFTPSNKLIIRTNQTNTATNLAYLGFSNSALNLGFILDDSAAIQFDSSTGGNFERVNSNEATSTTGTFSTAENTSYNNFEIGLRSGAVDYAINNSVNTSVATNAPNENLNIRLENSDAVNQVNVEWVAVSKYGISTTVSSVVGTEEIAPGALIIFDFNDPNGLTVKNKGIGTSALNGVLGNSTSVDSNDSTRTDSDCIKSNCLLFDGSNDLVTVPYNSTMNSQHITFSMWIKSENISTQQSIINRHLTAGNCWWVRQLNTGQIRFLVVATGGIEYLTTTDSLRLNTWIHLTGTYDGSDLKIYFNGEEANATIDNPSSSGVITTITQPLKIAENWNSGENLDGQIDEFVLFKRTLNSDEVVDLYDGENHILGEPIEEIPGNLLNYWKLDEGNGTSANSEVIGGSTGTLINMESDDWVNGKFASSLRFDGSNEYISMPVNDSKFNLTGPMSISIWVKREAAVGSFDSVISKTRNATTQKQYVIDINRNKFRFGDNQGVITSSDTITNGVWYHVVATYKGTTSFSGLKLYVNGELQNAGTVGTFNVFESGAGEQLYIGQKGDGTEFFNGEVDEIKIFDFDLDQQEVLNLYQTNDVFNPIDYSDPFSEDLIVYLKMDEASWNGTSGEVIDYAGGDHNGTRGGNATTTIDTRRDRVGTFDGVDDNVNVPFSPDFQTNTITISAWFKPDILGVNRTIATTEPGSGSLNGIGIRQRSNNKMGVFLGASGNATGLFSTSSLKVNQWTHLTATYDGTNLKLYVNGVLEGQTTSTRVVNSTSSLRFGWFSSILDEDFDGRIDDVKLYSRALSDDDALRLFNSAQPLFGGRELETTPILDIQLNQKSGTVVNDNSRSSSGTLVNMTGNEWTQSEYNNKLQNALSLDGTNYYIDINYSYTPSDFSISAWFKKDNVVDENDVIVSTKNSGAAVWLGQWDTSNTNNGNFSFGFTNGTTWQFVSTGANITDTNWHHVVGTKFGNTLQLYLDGNLVATSVSSGSPVNWTEVYIGDSGSTTNHAYFDGMIDEVKIWNTGISHSQFAKVYNSGNPIGYWKLDRGEGNTAYDYSGMGNPGTFVNMDVSNSWQEENLCILGKCIDFDGVDGYISIPDTNILRPQNALTFSAWINTSSNNVQGVVTKRRSENENPTNSYILVLDAGAIPGFTITTNSVQTKISSPEPISLNEWNHLLGVYDGSTMKLYINGHLVNQTIKSGNITYSSSSLRIGTSSTSFLQVVDGLIDEVKLWNYPLTEEDVLIEFNKGSALRFE